MLLRKIEQFLVISGIPWTKFGRIVAHDPRLVSDMRRGRQPRPAMVERIEAFIRTHAQDNQPSHSAGLK